MNTLIVVDDPKDWPLALPGVAVVSARAYLTDPAYGEEHALKVFNLCKSYRYQSLGYYVSLLAEARKHKPLPRVSTIEELQSVNLVRLLTEDLDENMQKLLAPIKSDSFELSIYFGRNVAARYDGLSRKLFGLCRRRYCACSSSANASAGASAACAPSPPARFRLRTTTSW